MTKFQKNVESILKAHWKFNYFNEGEEFYLKLEKEGYMDLVIERQGNTVMVGHYANMNGDLVSDPVLVFVILPSGEWYPWRIEQILGDTQVASENENGKLVYYPHKMADFISFSAMFASNLIHQGWKKARIKKFKGGEKIG